MAGENYLTYFSTLGRTNDISRNVKIVKEISEKFGALVEITSETCYYVVLAAGVDREAFQKANFEKLNYLLSHNVFHQDLLNQSSLPSESLILEVGPRVSFTTPFSTNAVSALQAADIKDVIRVEKSIRYALTGAQSSSLDPTQLFPLFGDRMVECLYEKPPTFTLTAKREQVYEIDVIGANGRENLEAANQSLGLALDKADFEYYYDFFTNVVKKNPTDVELFDLAQSNSEHSRHWFFRGKLFVDGVERPESLFKSIQDTQNHSNQNNVIAFSDNSSAIIGFNAECLVASDPTTSSALIKKPLKRHIIYTAETHNFPTGVCPFPGAATGTGGRIRDVQATGRGAHEIAGVAGYSVGNLHLEDYKLPWETEWDYPNNFASPQKILIDASNGASDYGNKFGEPVICGFARTFGLETSNGKRFEYVKPIMFSAGVGAIDDALISKAPCAPDQLIAKIGGPVYRIGVGGGAASSVQVQGDQHDELDFGAVQRGDPEMEQKLHRVIRGCIELERRNPILSIHDQGAGGNGNVLKEIVEGEHGGAIIEADAFELGDPTISIRELWGAEYQENNAVLVEPKFKPLIEAIATREKCNVDFVGKVTGDNRVIVKNYGGDEPVNPVDMDLTALGEREAKEFRLTVENVPPQPLVLPSDLTVKDALNRVLRLPAVASKRYLTNKVDRCVTGLIAQQQCVGPLHTPVADVAVTALSYFEHVGSAIAVGEQPIKGLVDPAIGARMSVGEALTNLVFAPITELQDVKCSGNWMWAAKVEGEGGRLVKACDAMCDVMKTLGIAIDGGKDSLSMAARGKDDKIICAPGTLVISAYAPCIDIRNVIAPDLKVYDEAPTTIVYISMANKRPKYRLGGSALAQTYSQLGSDFPDLDDPEYFKTAFNVVQSLVRNKYALSGHDVSDGGLITALLEMAFAGNCEIHANIVAPAETIEILFSEELGVLLEVPQQSLGHVLAGCQQNGILVQQIGEAVRLHGSDATVRVSVNGELVIDEGLNDLREIWEETSDRLELLQTAEPCVKSQIAWRASVKAIEYTAKFSYLIERNFPSTLPKVAILREEGSNGDREMAAAFVIAGFEAFDITMTDLANNASLEPFDGVAFVGGFSYGDVLGSAKGWSAALMYHENVRKALEDFKKRPTTFSLGICNGCQLMGLISWIGQTKEHSGRVFLDDNDCGRFHCGFATVKIEKSPAIMLRDMENSVLGVWTSHGEGKFTYDSPETAAALEKANLRCIRYCDNYANHVTAYPANPNQSVDAVAAVCSADGRHLAMMPHPDRSFMSWQWPNYPEDLKRHNADYSPWIRMFRNAYDWVVSQ
uniref:phosphoribosylformylglycinamidine synthase n=1 Tax=Panagrellus redivivus TaxID=6233 RepID=A0A7E4W4A2_PANRE